MGILFSNCDKNKSYKKLKYKKCSKCTVMYLLPGKYSAERKGCSIHLFDKKGICKHCHITQQEAFYNCKKCYHS